MILKPEQIAFIGDWRRPEPPSPGTNYVYFMHCHLRGNREIYVKIGHTKNPKKRMWALRSQEDFTSTEIIAQIQLPNKKEALELEQFLHDKFREHRVFGEYFYMRGSVAEFCRQLGVAPRFLMEFI